MHWSVSTDRFFLRGGRKQQQIIRGIDSEDSILYLSHNMSLNCKQEGIVALKVLQMVLLQPFKERLEWLAWLFPHTNNCICNQ